MATFGSVLRQHVLQAIAEYDERGADGFLGVYGFEPTAGYRLVHEGRGYDPEAILGVAHRYATGQLATADEFHGAGAAADILRRRGFVVTGPQQARAAGATPVPTTTKPRAAAARPPARRATVADRPPAVCPTCFVALPATGVCDTCG